LTATDKHDYTTNAIIKLTYKYSSDFIFKSGVSNLSIIQGNQYPVQEIIIQSFYNNPIQLLKTNNTPNWIIIKTNNATGNYYLEILDGFFYQPVGVYLITLQATNIINESIYTSFYLSIFAKQIEINTVSNKTIMQGDSFIDIPITFINNVISNNVVINKDTVFPDWLNIKLTNGNYYIYGNNATQDNVGNYIVEIIATDDYGGVAKISFTIEVININPIITTGIFDFDLLQNESIKDHEFNFNFVYDIQDVVLSDETISNMPWLSIVNTNNKYYLTGTPLNIHVAPLQNVNITVTDIYQLYTTYDLKINVINVNDQITNIYATINEDKTNIVGGIVTNPFFYNENETIIKTLYLFAEDIDYNIENTTEEHLFEIIEPIQYSKNGTELFEIENLPNNIHKLIINPHQELINYEYSKTMKVTIKSHDTGGDVFIKTFIIDVIDNNDNPTGAYLTNNTIPSNNFSAYIGAIKINDVDLNVKFNAYNIVYLDNIDVNGNPSIFEIVDGYLLKIKDGGVLMYDSVNTLNNEYTLNFTITENINNISPYTFNVSFNIVVVESLDEKYISTINDSTFNSIELTGNHIIKSNNTDNIIGNLTNNISLQDLNNYVYTYSITSDYDTNNIFEIINNVLKLKDGIYIDADLVQNITIVITTYTLNSIGDVVIYYPSTFNLSVCIIKDTPTDLFLSSTNVHEHHPDELVGQLTSNDTNFNNTFIYSIQHINDYTFFYIDGNNLKVKYNTEIDYHTNNILVITIDSTNQYGLTYSKEFSINVIENKIQLSEDYILEKIFGVFIANISVSDGYTSNILENSLNEFKLVNNHNNLFKIINDKLYLNNGKFVGITKFSAKASVTINYTNIVGIFIQNTIELNIQPPHLITRKYTPQQSVYKDMNINNISTRLKLGGRLSSTPLNVVGKTHILSTSQEPEIIIPFNSF
jgi:hypothetical protein